MQLVDYDVLRELAGVTDSGTGFMLQLTDGFALDARRALERIRACDGDLSRLAREAHRLKGASGTMGAAALAAECRAVEHCARAGDRAGVEAGAERALALLDASHGHIAAFFRGNIAATA